MGSTSPAARISELEMHAKRRKIVTDAGVALLTDLGHVIQTVFLYATGHEGYSGYAGAASIGPAS
jgi:hypothetical protein